MTVKTVVLDDEPAIIAIISSTMEQVFKSRAAEIEIQTFTSAKKCWEWLNGNRTDLLLLDINMPEIDGVKFGKKIRAELKDKSPDIIFVSSNEDRVFDTFELSAFGFVRKDCYLTDIARVLTRYIDTRLAAKTAPQVFEVKDGKGISVFDAEEIVYAESFRNNQIIHLQGGEKITLHSTMTMLEEKLCGGGNTFIRVHKSYIVNCEFVKNFGHSAAVLKNGDTVPVGRAYYVDGIEKYMNWIKLCGARTIKRRSKLPEKQQYP